MTYIIPYRNTWRLSAYLSSGHEGSSEDGLGLRPDEQHPVQLDRLTNICLKVIYDDSVVLCSLYIAQELIYLVPNK